ncbi:MAG: F0F1 ATP synthase subunit B [Alphaproteobacteria bacterium]|nr:F0F1 ATP synthase subunit B [Alphaproteobacteria bacterium]MDE2041851.1 F0F1 ATP synthase subunit B [Alphaproteobacteria bacterium]MDE2339589.1 F0F1 ATP synthase subunit B [Alphaproteobacteria bacterium]
MVDALMLLAVAAEAPEAEPTAFGLDAGGWVAAAMLVVFAILLWQKVPALVAGMLDKRIAEIKAQLDSAAKLRLEAEALKAEYEAKAKALVSDAEAMLAHAQNEAKLIVAKAEAETKMTIKNRTQMAKDKIAAAEAAAIAEVRVKAAVASAAAARKLIADRHGAAQDKALVSDAIARLN